ncbi:hypothetical protein D1872_282690 [compost metagenome]
MTIDVPSEDSDMTLSTFSIEARLFSIGLVTNSSTSVGVAFGILVTTAANGSFISGICSTGSLNAKIPPPINKAIININTVTGRRIEN